MAKKKMTVDQFMAETVERRPIDDLVYDARNSRKHSDEQIAQLMAGIREWGFTVPLLIQPDNTIIAGHGRHMAAKKLGMTELPVMVAEGWDEAQIRAYIIWDNKSALNSEWDYDVLRSEVAALEALDFSAAAIGFSPEELDDMFESIGDALEGEEDEKYTREVGTPVYEPTGDDPDVNELFDDLHYKRLLGLIEAADVKDVELKAFLVLAATRHIRFNYGQIAEKYAHLDADTQQLFEDSALVVIDFDDAIQNGYVKLTEEAMKAYKADGKSEAETEPEPEQEAVEA